MSITHRHNNTSKSLHSPSPTPTLYNFFFFSYLLIPIYLTCCVGAFTVARRFSYSLIFSLSFSFTKKLLDIATDDSDRDILSYSHYSHKKLCLCLNLNPNQHQLLQLHTSQCRAKTTTTKAHLRATDILSNLPRHMAHHKGDNTTAARHLCNINNSHLLPRSLLVVAVVDASRLVSPLYVVALSSKRAASAA
ncbi:hypothetical protein F5X98DRAFT_7359 [Xylaria grammica]|nr:hypothetical protein F5X98DRAFT_7359 [Xylaria grammica]